MYEPAKLDGFTTAEWAKDMIVRCHGDREDAANDARHVRFAYPTDDPRYSFFGEVVDLIDRSPNLLGQPWKLKPRRRIEPA